MVTILSSTFARHYVDQLRNIETKPSAFKRITNELSYLLAYEALKDMPYETKEIKLWANQTYKAARMDQQSIAIVPILRAGIGMLDGIHRLLPGAQVHFLGMYRNEETLEPVWYYDKIPQENGIKQAIVIDPMLATGGSMSATIQTLKDKGCSNIIALAIIGAPEGVKRIEQEHPDIEVFIATLDEKLNEKGYIIPGLGDAGDRIFNTE